MIYGVKLGFFSGDILKLMEDISILKPTYFPTVPRLLNKLYGKIAASIKNTPGFKGWLLRTAVDTKLQNYRNG